MKRWFLAGLMVVLTALAGCTPTIYGVPQQRWNAMGAQERIAAMEAYRAQQAALMQQRRELANRLALEREHQREIEAEKARQAALERQREERADRLRLERERKRAIEAEEARRHRRRAEDAYRGREVRSDLLQVSIHGGSMRLHGGRKPYRSVAFRIAAGETKAVAIVAPRGRKAALVVSYDGRNLRLDKGRRAHSHHAIRLVRDRGWEHGRSYRGLNDDGPLELRGVTVRIKVLGKPSRHHLRERPKTVDVRKGSGESVKPPRTPVKNAGSLSGKSGTAVHVREPLRHSAREAAGRQASAQAPKRALNGSRRESRTKKVLARRQRESLPPPRVRVTFSRGEIRIRGKLCPIVPQSFTLRRGEVRSVVLRGRLGRVEIRVGYQGGKVAVREHPGNGRPTAIFGFDKNWRAGATYRIRALRSRIVEALAISVRAM